MIDHADIEKKQLDSFGTESLDAMTAAPDHHKILLENEHVRVLDTRVGPGERTPVHTHRWPGIIYVLNWSDFKRYDSSGQLVLDSRTLASKPEIGEALWLPAVEAHFVENTGSQELRVIAVELKRPIKGYENETKSTAKHR
jgi:predicted metal-dependent enzyme (double-stranded beta helix superfamily)